MEDSPYEGESYKALVPDCVAAHHETTSGFGFTPTAIHKTDDSFSQIYTIAHNADSIPQWNLKQPIIIRQTLTQSNRTLQPSRNDGNMPHHKHQSTASSECTILIRNDYTLPTERFVYIWAIKDMGECWNQQYQVCVPFLNVGRRQTPQYEGEEFSSLCSSSCISCRYGSSNTSHPRTGQPTSIIRMCWVHSMMKNQLSWGNITNSISHFSPTGPHMPSCHCWCIFSLL